ncbi:flavodoxin [Epidermidibacterium keratini]|uniref:Flavodoxin n=1 Tax=Epidermidibacterium keratini TaxID=1891644 RepID=A0A7L4YSG8_9ACTN|nr:flavodoxin [Epidermidibacterium keratini]QHC01998.1 flavodoxin [Epidermidibacterium keratini]
MSDEKTADAPKVLVVHHTISPSTQAVYDAVMAGLHVEELAGLEVVAVPALHADVAYTLEASAVIVLSPVNIGYLAGAVKHYFDQIYYPCLEATRTLPFAAVLHSNQDAAGALRGLQAITTGLGWQQVAEPLIVNRDPDAAMTEQIQELASTVGAYAAGLM